MARDAKTTEYLLRRANALPLCPGVYIMKDKSGKVIYVGKSRKLKNRVSQYFQAGEKNAKTERMTSLVYDFETILCDTEIEALTLENNFIKQYSPKYNIKLKDAKSYPYIKITDEPYPRLVSTRRRENDKGKYFGPYSGTSTVYSVIGAVNKTLGLIACNRKFPRDIGKERPCIYYQMGRCCGVCTGKVASEQYAELVKSAADVLGGNTASVKRSLAERMTALAEAERFEEAARLRDTIAALDRLRERQKVATAPGAQQDVMALYSGAGISSLSIFTIRDGILTDRRNHIFGAEEICDTENISAFICEQYKMCSYIPPKIYISFDLDDEERGALGDYLTSIAGHKVTVITPQRGENKKLCDLALANATERVRQESEQTERRESALLTLTTLASLEVYPERIEAYDISNYGSDSMRAGMIVYEGGKFKKSDYRTFTIKTVEGTDDYAAMREALSRRLDHLGDEDGSFSRMPDLILLDGGRGHVGVISDLLAERGIEIQLLGMVKDDYHKTRALTDGEREINIAKQRDLFTLIYKIQEEVHRYTYGRTSAAKRKSLRTSTLTAISGIGEKKAKLLLTHFGGLAAIRSASREELGAVKGILDKDAVSVYNYFHREQEK